MAIAATVRVKSASPKVSASTGGLMRKTLIRMPSKASFPSLGEKDCLYVDESQGIVYLWEADTLTYTPIASDWHQIQVINGGNA